MEVDGPGGVLPNEGEHEEIEESTVGKKQKDTARNTQDELVRNTQDELERKIKEEPEDWKIQDPDKGPSYTVSEYMERLGHGNYTRWVTFVMSLVSFADSAEIAVTAVIIKALVCEWNLNNLQKALIPALILTGEAIGSFCAGKLADIFGRRVVMLYCYYGICSFSVVSIFAESYYVYLISRTFVGVFVGSCFPIAACYLHEMSPVPTRAQNLTVFSLIAETGSAFVCVCAVFLMELEHGWRLELTAILAVALLTLFFLHFIDESPRYFAITDDKSRATEVLRKIAHVNLVEMPIGTLETSTEMRGRYVDFIKQPNTRMSIIFSIISFCLMYTLNGMYYSIADLMSYGYCNLDEFFISTYTDQSGCVLYTQGQYLFYLVIHLTALPGIILGGVSAEFIGRVPSVIWSNWAILFFAACLIVCLYYIVTIANLVILILVLYLAICVLLIYAPEIYPTYMRTTSVGILNSFNRAGGAAGSFVAEYVDDFDFMITLYTYIALQAIASIVTLYIKRETKGAVLEDRRPESILERVSVTSYGTAEQHED